MGAVLMTAGIILVLYYFISPKLTAPIRAEYENLTANCGEYTAAVLDTHREKVNTPQGQKEQTVLIVQFRIEEQKRTVIHRCTEKFYGTYSRGDTVTLMYREGMPLDFALISGDNRFEHMISLISGLRIPAAISGAFLLLSGIILTLI